MFHKSSRPEDDRTDGGEPKGPPFVLLLLALTAGGGVIVATGLALFDVAMDHSQRQAEALPVEEQAAEEAVAVVEPEDGASTGELFEAQATVEDLETQLAAKEALLTELAIAAGLDGPPAEAEVLVEEVTKLRANLVAARQVRDRLKGELSEALAAVEMQTEETARFRSSAEDWRQQAERAQWRDLVSTAQVEVCDRGTRRAVDKCRAEVASYFTDDRYARYANCVREGGATPVLLRVDRGSDVPSTAEPVGPSPIFRTGDWYVLYCDPRLPEQEASWLSPDDEQVASLE